MLKIALVFLSGSMALGAATPTAHAQASAAAASIAPAAGCFVAPAALAAGEVNAFISQPGALLTSYPMGGVPLSGRVRALAGTSRDTLVPLVGLLSNATPSQLAAIGAGLARAARACAPVNPEYAAQIQDAVAGANNTAFEAAFLGASADTQTAALGAAGAAGGGGPGAGALGGGGNPGGGVNGSSNGGEGVEAGTSAFSAGASARYFAGSEAGALLSQSVSENGSQ